MLQRADCQNAAFSPSCILETDHKPHNHLKLKEVPKGELILDHWLGKDDAGVKRPRSVFRSGSLQEFEDAMVTTDSSR